MVKINIPKFGIVKGKEQSMIISEGTEMGSTYRVVDNQHLGEAEDLAKKLHDISIPKKDRPADEVLTGIEYNRFKKITR